jgi:hypothetical protein
MYVTAEEYRRLSAAADPILRDAMALVYCTGQGVSDVPRIRDDRAKASAAST